MTYTVVLLNGKEESNLTSDQVKELFFRRQINQDSLILSKANPRWQMLKREFDLGLWMAEAARYQHSAAPSVPDAIDPAQPPIGQFEQPVAVPVHPEVPATEPMQFGTPSGYNQNSQTETFYQAESLPADGKLRNVQSNYAPTAVRYEPVPATPSLRGSSGVRNGFRAASAFIGINILLYLGLTLIAGSAAIDSPDKVGQLIGKSVLPIIIDLYLAARLWGGKDVDGARRWVLVRSYVGFFIGLALPFAGAGAGEVVIGLVFGVAGFFYLLAIGLVLHGKQSPSNGRVYAGVGSFAVFALISFLLLGLAGLGKALPALAKMDLASPQMAKYKIDGTEFTDKTTGAHVMLPEGWTMLSTSNPIVNTPTARMIAIDKPGKRLAMLEVVPVPAQLDMKRETPNAILDRLCDGVVQTMQEESDGASVFGRTVVKEMSRISTYIGKHPAKLLIVEKSDAGQQYKGHVIITYDELTFYVFHYWCPTSEYLKSQDDFTYFEKNFSVPDNINSTFTQTAENERRK